MIPSAGSFCFKLKRDSCIKWGFRLSSTAILISLSFCFYWLGVDRSLPITVTNGEVIKYEHQPDNSWIMIVRWRGQLNRRCGGISKRWLIDGFRLPLIDFPYPPEMESQQLGDFSWEVPIHVPAYYVSTGHTKGTYRARFMYSCNKLQEIVFPIIDEPMGVPFVIPVDSIKEGAVTNPNSDAFRPN